MGSKGNQNTVEQLSEFVGLKNDSGKTAKNVYKPNHSRMPTIHPEREEITNGIKWYLLASSIKDSSYWFSPNLQLKTSLLWINYELSVNNRLFSTKYPRNSDIQVLESVFSYWGFLPKILPNFAFAEMLEELSGTADTHFDVISINPTEARQIIKTETQELVLKWSEKHPYRIPPKAQYHITQDNLTMLVNSSGIHLVTILPNTSPAIRDDELIELGVEFVKAQG